MRTSKPLRISTSFELSILVDYITANRHIFSFDHVDNNLALAKSLKILGRFLLDKWLQFAASHEELLANCDQEVCIIAEFFFLDS